ncbi:CRISPR system Cascade subunit CasE [Lipingzhangella halophila]|uniref:CRISPR system Cascade subunit CasE n=1 Tax=Lipingzhangella halophila TaxID=1783352 RepID=A0A7W7RJX2_9ACTN|nr:type I-E CRISPR-associated protein Cas6/Cse3/CasE [Lipingzhangella halophila]MBB4933306.1 CRISPR system Cascade subunit CasE [Lipingzhangella halophila]
MYLTRFRLNTARSGTRKLLSSPQAMHAAVLAGFPDLLPSDSDAPRVLWRVDRVSAAEVFLYVVSSGRPDYTHLVEQAGWPAAGTGWQTGEYAPFLEKLAAGDVWRFRLTANPVHSVRTKDGQETKVTAHVTWRHQADWLLQRQEAAGFRVARKPDGEEAPEGQETPDRYAQYELMVHDQRRLEFSKGKRNGSGKATRVRVNTATFDGRLEVTDPEALRRTLTAGLGRAKAYGCGLMTLAPVE